MDQEITKKAYTLIGLVFAVSTLSSLGAVSLYKIDKTIDDQIAIIDRLGMHDSQLNSRSEMDKGQNLRIDRLEQRVFIPQSRPAGYSF